MSFRTGPSVFKDRGKVSFDYVPEKLPHRESQLQRMFSIFRPVGDSGIAANAFLYGSVGTGKTHSAKRFCEDFRVYANKQGRGLDHVHVNCRQKMGDDAVLLHILKHFDARFPDRGFSIPEKLDSLRKWLGKQRVGLAFHPGTVDDKIVALIADIASEYGDARYAIDLLEGAGAAADAEISDEVGPEHVRIAKAGVTQSDLQERLAELDRNQRLVLLGIARKIRKKTYITTGDAEEAYHVVCEEFHEKRRAHKQILKYLHGLDAMGLIDAKKSGEGVVGKTTMISLPGIPAKTLADNIESTLKRRKAM